MDAPPPEAFSRVRYLYDSLTPKPDELLAKGRYYIREGPLLVWDENRRKKSKRYIFLLNDVLLITKRDGRSKYWLRVFITLRSSNVAVENMSSGFDAAFRLSVKTRSFVFFSDSEVDSWIEDLQKCISGPKSDFGSGHGDSVGSGKRSTSSMGSANPSSTAYAGRATSVRSSTQQDFSFFTDGDFFETKVNFDSGVKLGAIRTDRGGGDSAPVPVLAPPPRSNSSLSSGMSRSGSSLPSSPLPAATGGHTNGTNGVGSSYHNGHAPAATAAPATSNSSSTQSLEEFLGLKPSVPSTAPANGSSSANLFAAPTQPAKPATTTNGSLAFDFGGISLAPAQPAGMSAQPNWGGFPAASTTTTAPATQPQYNMQPLQPMQPANNTGAFNPFASPAPANPSAYPSYGMQPSYGAATQPAYPASSPFGTAPAQPNYGAASPFGAPAQPQQAADPFAALWSSPAPQPKGNKQVDFF